MEHPGLSLWPALLLLAAGCGGGGAAAPPTLAGLSIELVGTRIAAGQVEGQLTARLETVPAGLRPVLLQGELQVLGGGTTTVVIPAGTALQQVQNVPTLDGQAVDGAYRVLCGDGATIAGAALAPGPLFRLRIQAAAPRTPGTARVRLGALRIVDAAGTVLPLASDSAEAEVVVD